MLFRPNFMLASEEHLMKTHKNQWFLNSRSLLMSLVEPRTKAHPMVPEVQTLMDALFQRFDLVP